MENDNTRRYDAKREYERSLNDDKGLPAGIGSTAQPDPALAEPDADLDETFLYLDPDSIEAGDDEEGFNQRDTLSHQVSRDAHEQPMSSNADVLNLDPDLLLNDEESGYNMGFGDPNEEEGTTDVMAVIEDGLTYFPPLDPVLTSQTNDLQGEQVSGGFSTGSDADPYAPTELLDATEIPGGMRMTDDDLAEAVVRALRSDSYTSDLAIEVRARHGVVYLRGQMGSLDESEQAVAVAGEVPGVEEVNEDELDFE